MAEITIVQKKDARGAMIAIETKGTVWSMWGAMEATTSEEMLVAEARRLRDKLSACITQAERANRPPLRKWGP